VTVVLLVGGPHAGETRDVLPSVLAKPDRASIPVHADREPGDREPSRVLGRYRFTREGIAEWEEAAAA
jgi:hypothetical protein